MKELIKLLYLVLKDLKIEIRRGFELSSLFLFVLLVSLLISYSSYFVFKYVAIPSFFILVIFVAIFSSTTTFVREVDKNTLLGLKIAPIKPATVFMSKSIFTFILVSINGLFASIFLTVFTRSFAPLEILPAFFVFAVYVSTVSSFSSALVMYSEGKSSLIPMLTFVFVFPIIPSLMNLNVQILALETALIFLAFTVLFDYLMEI